MFDLALYNRTFFDIISRLTTILQSLPLFTAVFAVLGHIGLVCCF